MGLGTTWWTNNGAASLWTDNFVGMASCTKYDEGNMTRINFAGPFVRFFQKAYTNGAGSPGQQMKNAGFDSGYVYIEESTSGEKLYASSVFPYDDNESWLQPLGANFQPPRYHTLYPECRIYDLQPVVDSGAGADNRYTTWPFFKPPWFDVANGYTATQWFMFAWVPKKAGTWYLGHYAPYAWSGTPPEVVASILLTLGLSSTYIDTGGFDKAHDAYNLSTGVSPYKDVYGATDGFNVYASRKVGDTVAGLVQEVARHSRDFYYVDERGKVGCNCFVDPNNVISGLGFDDGVINSTFTDTDKYIINRVACRWGSGVRQWGDGTNRPDNTAFTLSISDEDMLDSYTGDKWLCTYDDATSQNKYGVRPAKGRDAIINTDGSPREAEVSHFPFLLDSLYADLGDVGPAALLGFRFSDSQTRKEITVKQNLLGADYGLGDKVEDVAVTGDSVVVPDTRCVEKTYNFSDLTVESVLLEIPPN